MVVVVDWTAVFYLWKLRRGILGVKVRAETLRNCIEQVFSLKLCKFSCNKVICIQVRDGFDAVFVRLQRNAFFELVNYVRSQQFFYKVIAVHLKLCLHNCIEIAGDIRRQILKAAEEIVLFIVHRADKRDFSREIRSVRVSRAGCFVGTELSFYSPGVDGERRVVHCVYALIFQLKIQCLVKNKYIVAGIDNRI